MKAVTLIALVVTMLSIEGRGGPPPSKPGTARAEAPTGQLGYRIGTYLTIEGVRAEEGKVGVRTLLVDTISGHKLETPVRLWIDNVDLPKEQRCVLKGYESGRWIGVPYEVLKATGQEPPQAAWQFHFHFVVTSVEQPKELPFEKQKTVETR